MNVALSRSGWENEYLFSPDLRVGDSNPSGRASQFTWPKIRLFVLRRPLTYLASVTAEASKICHIKCVIDTLYGGR